MTAAIYLTAVPLLGSISVALGFGMRAYVKFRGTRLVTCPETGDPAAVDVDARHVAFAAALLKRSLRLKRCSQWPERQDCVRECLGQIESAPEQCLVRTILTRWYEEKSCIFCGKALGEINWLEHRPALMNPYRMTLEWNEIRPEELPQVLSTHRPVCWNCHIAETFRRKFPHLVVDRPWRRRDELRQS